MPEIPFRYQINGFGLFLQEFSKILIVNFIYQ